MIRVRIHAVLCGLKTQDHMTAFSRTTTDRTYYSSKHQLCAIETSYKAGLSFSYSTKGELHLRLNKLHINEKKNLCFFKTYLIFIYVYGGGAVMYR